MSTCDLELQGQTPIYRYKSILPYVKFVKMGECAFPKKRHTVIKQQNQPSLSPILSAKQQNDN